MANWYERFIPKSYRKRKEDSWIRSLVTGSFYKVSDIRSNTSFSNIRVQIDTMRALAKDSQISTALSYYATDATTTNSSGQIIWATAVDPNHKDVADIVNQLFKRLKVNLYARDHILELATIGNLYIPTTMMYAEDSDTRIRTGVILDNNTIPNTEYDIIPSYKIPPENIVHLWQRGKPKGYIYQPDENSRDIEILPENACIHFSLGGLLGDYSFDVRTRDGGEDSYDIQFAHPLLEDATQPTQSLSLLEDAAILSSLSRVIKFINVECGNVDEDEMRDALQSMKDAIEQQLALDTATGDVQSYVNPQSPNNLIFLPKKNGNDIVSVTDLNMAESSQADNELLNYYQDKKLSVIGVPKEAMNFSSSEGLGNAGAVLSQRSALYANALDRLENAYKEGWTAAINEYFKARNMGGFVDKFTLHMNPIITAMSEVVGEKRDAVLNQATSLVEMFKTLGVKDKKVLLQGLVEILSEEFPTLGSQIISLDIDLEGGEEDENF